MNELRLRRLPQPEFALDLQAFEDPDDQATDLLPGDERIVASAT
jgi:hypothetical protein